MLSRCRTQRCLSNNGYLQSSVAHFSSSNPQPQPFDTHPNPNPILHAHRYAVNKKYKNPNPWPSKFNRPKYMPLEQQNADSAQSQLSTHGTVDGMRLLSNHDSHANALIPASSYSINADKRKSFGIVDDETSYKQIRKGLEMAIRAAKSTQCERKGLDGILALSTKFQRLLDQSELLETPKYAFPLFDEIFFAFQKYGIMSDRPYNQMIVQCERREMHSRCVGVLKRMLDAGVRPNSYTLHFLIRCLAKGQVYGELERLFQVWRQAGLVEQTRMEYWHLKNLLNLCVENGRPDLVLKFLNLTQDLQLLQYQSRHGDVVRDTDIEVQQQIMRKLCLFGSRDAAQLNAWMTFFTSHWDMQRVRISNRVLAPLLTYNEVHSLEGLHALCAELGIDMDTHDIALDVHLMEALLNSMRRKSNEQFSASNEYKYTIKDGLHLFEFALATHGDSFAPTITCFNHLIAMIKSGRDIKIASQLMHDIKTKFVEVKPDKFTAIHLLRLLYFNPSNFSLQAAAAAHEHGVGGDYIQQQKSGHQLLNELIDMGLKCNPIDQDVYHALIQLHAYFADFDGFLLTLYKMKAENEVIEQWQHGVGVDVEAEDEMGDELEVIRKQRAVRKIEIDENAFEPILEPILLNKLAASGQVENCCLVLDEMIECGFRPTGPVYRDIIERMGKFGYGAQALQMIDRALLDGILFSDRIWRYWMLSFAKRGQVESCLLLVDKMDRSSNVRKITTAHFNGLLYAYYKKDDLDAMHTTYQYMVRSTQQQKADYKVSKMRIKPDIKSYHIMATAYLENHESQRLHALLENMEYYDMELDWKMHSIAMNDMLGEADVSWSTVQQYLAALIGAKKVFPRQPMVDDVLTATMQLNVLPEGINFLHQILDDPDVRTSTLPKEPKLGEFIAAMFLRTYQNAEFQQLYRGMLAYLTEKYQHLFVVLNYKLPSKPKTDDPQQQTMRQQKENLSSFRFRPRRLLLHAFLALNEQFDALTCSMRTPSSGASEESETMTLDCRQLLVDVLRHLFAPMDDLKSANSKQKQQTQRNKLVSCTDEQLLSAYYPMIESVLTDSVKQHPSLVLLASTQLGIPIKPALFTKMIHSLVFNGRVDVIKAIAEVIDSYYNANAANPYIAYFQHENDSNANETTKTTTTTKSALLKPEKPWLISSNTEWTFLPFQMIDDEELERVNMKISDLILFDAWLYDKQLEAALQHLSYLHREQKVSLIIIKQIVQRTLNYMHHSHELKVNDKQYITKVVSTLSAILNQIPTINDCDLGESGETQTKFEKRQKQKQQSDELFECIWNENGFTRGAIILQGILMKLDKNHCLKAHLQKFCVREFSKLQRYGLLQSDSKQESTMLIDTNVYQYPLLEKRV